MSNRPKARINLYDDPVTSGVIARIAVQIGLGVVFGVLVAVIESFVVLWALGQGYDLKQTLVVTLVLSVVGAAAVILVGKPKSPAFGLVSPIVASFLIAWFLACGIGAIYYGILATSGL